MKNRIILILAMIVVAPAICFAKPGPVTLTFMERVEWHSDVRSIDPADPAGTYKEAAFLYSLLSASRKLDENVFGNIFYIHKFDVDDGESASHVGGVNLTHKMTGKWQMDYSYSYNSNPERNVITSPESSSDRLSFSLSFKWNPMEKVRKRYELKSTFSTGTDFSFGRTLSEKIIVRDNLSKKMDYSAAYTFVWGLTEAPDRGMYRTHFANQWSLDLNYKISKLKKLSLGYMFLNNQFHGAVTDDNILRLSFFATIP